MEVVVGCEVVYFHVIAPGASGGAIFGEVGRDDGCGSFFDLYMLSVVFPFLAYFSEALHGVVVKET